jgi:hypothetical protein
MRSNLHRFALAALLSSPPSALAIGTALTYQGTLEDGGVPANGPYDLQFQLQDGGGAAIGAPILVQDVNVVRGVFTVELDFGGSAFDGNDRRLSIGVRPGPSGGAFTLLVPPGDLNPAPYAQVAEVAQIASSISSNTVATANVVDGSIGAVDVNASQVQRRVSGSCAAGSAISLVNVDGTVGCQAAGAGSFSLPFVTSQEAAGPLFAITNTGTGGALAGSTAGAGGNAGQFVNTSPTNISANTLQVTSNSNGNIPDNTLGNVASFVNTNTNSVSAAVRGEVTTIFGNFGAAGVFGVSKGTGGFAGLFHSSNTSGNGPALVAIQDGNGNAITANASKDGNGVEANIDGAGNALYAWVPSFATGRAGRFNIFNENNTSDAVTVTTVGNGIAVNAKVDKVTGTSPALRGEVTSQFANFGTAGVYGISSGTGGYAGLFHASNPAGNGPALIAIADGNGNGVTANASNTGDGVETTADGTGSALYAWVPNFGQGRAGRMVNFNTANTNPVFTAEQHSNGSIAVFKSGNPGTVNVARINSAGRGFFNGGTQASGADLAELVPHAGGPEPQPGDVVEIDPGQPNHFRLAASANSTLVAGVISTAPGMLLNAPGADESVVPEGMELALAGRVPVKVSAENGAVHPGDLLVSASIPGHAMRAPANPALGTIVGKALETLEQGTGTIEMLVMLR